MSYSLEQILGAQNLIGLIETVKSGIPLVPGTEAFFDKSNSRDVLSDYATYRKVKGSRRLAQTVEYGAASKAAPMQDVSETSIKLIHSAENQVYKQAMLQNLQGFAGVAPQRMAVDEITRQTKEFKKRFENLHIASVYSMIANGKIWLKGDGTFLFNSSGAVITVDYGVPTNQNGVGSAVIPGFSAWNVATNPIIQQINGMKQAAVQRTGYPLKNALYGKNVADMLLTNNETYNLIVRNPSYNSKFLDTGTIPTGFLNMNWVAVQDAFAEDSTGTVQKFFGDNSISFMPEIGSEWYEWLNGSYAIPENVGVIGADAASILREMKLTFGQFSYATPSTDPIGIKQVAGDTFMPVTKNGSVLFIVTDVTM